MSVCYSAFYGACASVSAALRLVKFLTVTPPPNGHCTVVVSEVINNYVLNKRHNLKIKDYLK